MAQNLDMYDGSAVFASQGEDYTVMLQKYNLSKKAGTEKRRSEIMNRHKTGVNALRKEVSATPDFIDPDTRDRHVVILKALKQAVQERYQLDKEVEKKSMEMENVLEESVVELKRVLDRIKTRVVADEMLKGKMNA